MSDQKVAPNDNYPKIVQIGPYLGTETSYVVGGGQFTVTIKNNEHESLTNAQVLFCLHMAMQQFNESMK